MRLTASRHTLMFGTPSFVPGREGGHGPLPRPAALVLVLAVAAGLLGGAPARADASPAVDVARTTRIVAQGDGGAVIRVAEATTLGGPETRLLIDKGDFAFAGIAHRDCSRELDALCMRHRVEAYSTPGWNFSGPAEQVYVAGSTLLSPGEYDVYVVTDGSDGAATLTLTFPDAPPGEITLAASGGISATLERLGPECPEPTSCEEFGYGHATHEVDRPGFVMVTAISYFVGAGFRTLSRCMDPLLGDGPPSTGETTLGCPTLPGEGPGPPNHLVGLVTNVTGSDGFPGGMRIASSYNNDPSGAIRVGYTGAAYGSEAYGHAGWGLWLDGGIDLTSG